MKKENKTERLFVRLTKSQKEELQRRAYAYHLSLSQYIEFYLFCPERLCLRVEKNIIL